MKIEEVCLREQLAMGMRRICGHDQQDDHVWRWLNHHVAIWSAANPVRIFKDDWAIPQSMQQLKGSVRAND